MRHAATLARRWRILFIGGLAGTLLACAAVQMLPGERLVRSKCSACHPRPQPERFDRAGWVRILERHKKRVPLEAEQRALILDHMSGTEQSPTPVPAAP